MVLGSSDRVENEDSDIWKTELKFVCCTARWWLTDLALIWEAQPSPSMQESCLGHQQMEKERGMENEQYFWTTGIWLCSGNGRTQSPPMWCLGNQIELSAFQGSFHWASFDCLPEPPHKPTCHQKHYSHSTYQLLHRRSTSRVVFGQRGSPVIESVVPDP